MRIGTQLRATPFLLGALGSAVGFVGRVPRLRPQLHRPAHRRTGVHGCRRLEGKPRRLRAQLPQHPARRLRRRGLHHHDHRRAGTSQLAGVHRRRRGSGRRECEHAGAEVRHPEPAGEGRGCAQQLAAIRPHDGRGVGCAGRVPRGEPAFPAAGRGRRFDVLDRCRSIHSRRAVAPAERRGRGAAGGLVLGIARRMRARLAARAHRRVPGAHEAVAVVLGGGRTGGRRNHLAHRHLRVHAEREQPPVRGVRRGSRRDRSGRLRARGRREPRLPRARVAARLPPSVAAMGECRRWDSESRRERRFSAERLRALPHDQFGGQHRDPVDARARHELHEHAGHRLAQADRRLVHRRQGRRRRQAVVVVVVADDRDVVRDAQPGFVDRRVRARGHLVVRGEQSVDGYPAVEQPLHRLASRGRREVAVFDERLVETVRVHRAPPAGEAVEAGGHVLRSRDDRDVAASASDEVFGRSRRALDIVHIHEVGTLLGLIDRPATEHHRQRLPEVRIRVVAGVVRDDERAVDVSAHEVAAGLVGLELRRDDHVERVLGLGEVQRGALHDGCEERVGEDLGGGLGDDERHDLGAFARERACCPVGHIVEVGDRFVDRLDHLGRDLRGPVDHPGHGRARNSGQRRDRFERRHSAAFEFLRGHLVVPPGPVSMLGVCGKRAGEAVGRDGCCVRPLDDARVLEAAVFHDPLLRLVVDTDDPEPLVVAPRPFEVVEQRPHEVAPHIRPLRDRFADRVDVRPDVRRALAVVNPPVGRDLVVVRCTVLGDVQRRQRRIFLAEAHEQAAEPVRVDLPAHRGARERARREADVLAARERRAFRTLGRLQAAQSIRRLRVTADVVVVVVVDADEVDGLRDDRQVAVLDHVGEPEARHILEQILRVPAEQDRLQEHPVPQRVDATRGLEVDRVGRVVRYRVGEVERDAEPEIRGLCVARGRAGALAQGLDGEAVREVLVVDGRQGGAPVAAARGVFAGAVRDER